MGKRRELRRLSSARIRGNIGLSPEQEVSPDGSDVESTCTDRSKASSIVPFATLQAALTELQSRQSQPRRSSSADLDVQQVRLEKRLRDAMVVQTALKQEEESILEREVTLRKEKIGWSNRKRDATRRMAALEKEVVDNRADLYTNSVLREAMAKTAPNQLVPKGPAGALPTPALAMSRTRPQPTRFDAPLL